MTAAASPSDQDLIPFQLIEALDGQDSYSIKRFLSHDNFIAWI